MMTEGRDPQNEESSDVANGAKTQYFKRGDRGHFGKHEYRPVAKNETH